MASRRESWWGHGKGVKFHLTEKLKENGCARIILNMSRGEPFCVNDGIKVDERFEVSMSSTKMWLRSLHAAGRGCWMCKLDWEVLLRH